MSIQERKSKQTLIVFDLWYKNNPKNKHVQDIFYLKRKLNQVSVTDLLDWRFRSSRSGVFLEKGVLHKVTFIKSHFGMGVLL